MEYSEGTVDYAQLDPVPIQEKADYYVEMAIKSDDVAMQTQLIQYAAGQYFLLSKINPEAITPYVQLARIYDISEKDALAKEYFFKATNIENLNPFANFYFGEFYFRRDKFRRALKHYQIAYNNGYSNIYDLNIRLATIYEKVGDLVKAKKYYEIAQKLDPTETIAGQKIEQIKSLNYDKSGYYDGIRE